VKSFFLALCYVSMIGALLWAISLHRHVSPEVAYFVMATAAIVGLIIFVDDYRQQRRKWRDHPNRRRGILKEWNE
jgi:UDP-N-acetylmuramyl pentapeptide phosphotransferase/UDP-N-acetylglucosamine-1-phosphate transferase